MSRKTKLDSFDYRILEVLQLDATITNKQLAKQIGLSPPATLERVRNLLKKDYLLGSGYRLNWEKLGFKFRILLVANIAHKDNDLYLNAIKDCPQILQTNLIKQEESLGLFYDDLRYVSIGVFRNQEEFLKAWTIISSSISAPIKFYVWELDKQSDSNKCVHLL